MEKGMERRRVHISRQTAVKSLVVDVSMTVEQCHTCTYGWNGTITALFAMTARRTRGMNSIKEISHGEGPYHAVGPEQEHTQVLQPPKRG
jgi:hypothetical protein